MSELTAADVIDVMCARYTSGNSIPVERAYITRKEWQALMATVADDRSAPDLLEALKALRSDHSRIDPHHEDLCPLCKQADAAIRKATGLE